MVSGRQVGDCLEISACDNYVLNQGHDNRVGEKKCQGFKI